MSASLLRKLNEARSHLHAGDVASAQSLCRELLARAPRNPDVLCLLGVTELAGGRAREAIATLKQALAAAPRHGMASEHLGLAHLMLGEWDAAEHALRIASGLPGAPPSVLMRLGVALLNQGRHVEAIRELERALARDAQNPDIHINLGQAHEKAGDTANARRHFERVLLLAPDHADALFNLGVLSLEQGALDDARQWFERALSRAPQHADALVNLGVVHERQNRPREALNSYQRAVEVNPALAHARDNLARMFALEGRFELAREHFLIALQLAPTLIETRQALAAACVALGRFKEGITHLREVVRLQPSNLSALNTLADALFENGELDESATVAQNIMAQDPAFAGAYALTADIHAVKGELDRAMSALEAGDKNTQAPYLLGRLAFMLRRLCEWKKWSETWLRLAAMLDQHPGAATPFSLLCEPTTPAQQLACARHWSAAQYGVFATARAEAAVSGNGHSRLRIGYLSSDFYEHATAYLLAEVLELHDRSRFEIFAYSYGPEDHSPMRARLRQACEHFIDIARDPDDVAARRIQDDAIDILIDLKGYTMGARPAILARRPCPLQVSWIGYPGTMGAPFIDCLIADPFIIPARLESAYAERILRLPHCYQPNDRQRPVAEPLARAAYGLPDNGFVFCCFNQAYKITPEVFASWMRLLKQVPGSVLWLLEDNRWAAENLKRECAGHGIAAERLIFAPKLPLAQHLARYALAGLALDTFPYGSHTTASDALWSSCPLLALCGDTFASRVSGSILSACGLPELITHGLEDYEKLALRIAQDLPYAESLRAQLMRTRASAPLFDSITFTRDLEHLYTDLAARPRN
jgi:protein O-GlcNAc transferase